jgi:hypothetical protein
MRVSDSLLLLLLLFDVLGVQSTLLYEIEAGA